MNLVVRKAAWSIGLTAAVAAAIGLVAPAQAAEGPDVSIGSATYEGSGCLKGRGVEATLDEYTIYIGYEKLSVTVGDEGDPVSARAFCQASLQLRFEKGWKYRIEELTMHGSAHLKSAPGEATVTPFYGGSAEASKLHRKLGKDHKGKFKADKTDLNWSNCDDTRRLNIKAEVFVQGEDATGSSELKLDAEQGVIAQLKFDRC